MDNEILLFNPGVLSLIELYSISDFNLTFDLYGFNIAFLLLGARCYHSYAF